MDEDNENRGGGDPVVIAMIKGLAAGAVNLCAGAVRGDAAPASAVAGAALALGFLSIGVSLVLYIVALRHLGAARTAAHYSTAPFIGAAAAFVLLGEPFTPTFAAALALMVIATWLVLTERHEHQHSHAAMEHDHLHVHDIHHRHAPAGGAGAEPHAHRHEPPVHTHPHLPDLHHRHRH